jgi:predicted LPLAT superfamily acyltransferase
VNAKDENGWTSLMGAASSGLAETVEVVRVMLDHGADVNAKSKNDHTALMMAATGGKTNIVKVLLVAGADVNARDKRGSTALMAAASLGYASTVEALLTAGADVNAQDQVGETALMKAAGGVRVPIVQILLASGADVNAKSKNGSTALTLAKRKGSAEVVKILKNAGATDTEELGERKEETAVAAIPSQPPQPEVNLGLNVQDLTPELADKFKIKYQEGVLVGKVEPGSVAQEQGLREGDLIKEVNRQAVTSAEEFKAAVAQTKKWESVLLRIFRENRLFYSVLSPKEK